MWNNHKHFAAQPYLNYGKKPNISPIVFQCESSESNSSSADEMQGKFVIIKKIKCLIKVY